MRKIILLLILVVPIAMMAQKGNFTLSGKVGNLNAPAKIYLVYRLATGNVLDSSAIQNGQFEFKGSIRYPIRADLIINRMGSGVQNPTNERLEVYLESGTIKVNSSDSLSNANITGSKINADNKKLQLAFSPIIKKDAAFNARINAMKKEKRTAELGSSAIQEEAELIRNELMQVYCDFIKSNTNSYLSLTLLNRYGPAYPDLTAPLYNALTEEVKQTEFGKAFAVFLKKMNTKEYADSVQQAKGVAIGEMAPQFSQNDPDGKPIKLSDFKGKYVLIDFWASWCGPCRGENPNVVKAYAIYHDKGLEILGVSLDTQKDAWVKAISDDQLPWKHVSDLKGFKNEVAVLYGIRSVPSNLLIDPEGKVIAKDLRESDLTMKLAEIFN